MGERCMGQDRVAPGSAWDTEPVLSSLVARLPEHLWTLSFHQDP